jgi:hypothetical protein
MQAYTSIHTDVQERVRCQVLFAVHNPLQSLFIVSPPEGGAAYEQLVEQTPERPQVDGLVVAAS